MLQYIAAGGRTTKAGSQQAHLANEGRCALSTRSLLLTALAVVAAMPSHALAFSMADGPCVCVHQHWSSSHKDGL